MKDRLEKIDLIKERANVTYQEAKEALEKNDYDVLETLIDLERQSKLKDEKKVGEKSEPKKEEKKTTPSEDGISQSIKRLFKKSMSSSFILKDKNKEQVLKLPLLIAALLILFTLPFSLLVLILAVVFKYKLIIKHDDGKTTCFNEVIDNLNEEYDSRKENKTTKASDDEEVKDAEYKINLDK